MIKTPSWPIPLGVKPIDLGLERIRQLMGKLGVGEKNLPPVIHVAGTNGKGSTIAFLRAFLEAAGYSVHVYTSPHLVYFNERIVLAGKMISDEFLGEVLAECKEAARDIPVTFFEGTTAAAFLAFSRIPADILLLETGMGGRLDATNIIEKPLLIIITPISLDHMAYLGDTLVKIAGEKAAIMKPSVACVLGKQEAAAAGVIEMVAREKGVELLRFGHEWRVEKTLLTSSSISALCFVPCASYLQGTKHKAQSTDEEEGFKFISNDRTINLPSPALPGDHQLLNAGVAIAALEKMPDFKVSPHHIITGLKSVTWPARLQHLTTGRLTEMLPGNYSLWLDGGHNRAGGEILAEWLRAVHKTHNVVIPALRAGIASSGNTHMTIGAIPGQAGDNTHMFHHAHTPEKIYLICGMLREKEVSAFLENFSGIADELFAITIPDEEKALPAAEIVQIAMAAGIKSQAATGISDALEKISRLTTSPALILICGSLYLAGAVLEENNKHG